MRQGEHVIIAGMTGSGKTTLARRLLSTKSRVIVIDSKHELKWEGFRVTNSREVALNGTHTILRPSSLRSVSQLLEAIYKQGGWNIYIDEIYSLGRGSSISYPQSYIQLLTRGRSRHITVWTSTQRPRYLPLFAFTEAQHVFVFRLRSHDDRKHIAKLTGIEQLEKPLEGHDFLYYGPPDWRVVKSVLGKEDL